MRNKFLIPIYLLIFPLLSNAFDGEKKVSSTITHVTVFRSQAQVQRVAKIDLNAGVTNLIFENLSPYINENSIEVKAGTDVTLLSVTTQNDYLKQDEKPPYIKALEDSLALIDDSLSVFKSNKETIMLQKELLLANRNTGSNQAGVKSDDLEDLIDLYRKKLDDFNNEWFYYTSLERRLIAIKTRVQQQLSEYNSEQRQSSYKIIISLKAEKPVRDEQIELIYLVSNVGWQPFYDIRVKDVKSGINILCKAKVTQSTGEDWNNVLLKLTTANPSEGGVKPELQTNWLRFYEQRILNEVVVKQKRSLVDAEAMQRNDQRYASAGIATVQETAINTEFAINIPYHVPSDNHPHTVDLTVLNLPAEYIYATAPKLDKDVFVTARVLANEIINSLHGEANVYFGGTFTGRTFIGSTTEDTLQLSLGRDKRIQIERKRLKEMSAKSFFGGSKTETSVYEISIRNTRKEAITIVVEDQIPVSTEKEIEVKPTANGGGTYDAETGKLKWTIILEPEKTQTLQFGFEVKYPKGKTITPY